MSGRARLTGLVVIAAVALGGSAFAAPGGTGGGGGGPSGPGGAGSGSLTQDMDRARDMTRDQKRLHQTDDIYGSEVMTMEERNRYQRRIQSLRSQAERAQFETQHRAEMRKRAKTRGVTLAEPNRPDAGAAGGGAGAGGGDLDQDRTRDRDRIQDPDRD